MKNLINYYYNLIPTEIIQKEDNYELIINNGKYLFTPYYGNINDVIVIYNYLINIKVYCHEIIYNNENQIITINNNKPYVLLKIHYDNNRVIELKDIIAYNININNPQKCNWKKLWCEKIDYYEYQIKEFGKKYSLIKESFSYYDGLCENAISLLNIIEMKNMEMYINHKRIKYAMTNLDFYNPLNLTIDNKVRDVSDYFKINFFKNENIIKEVQLYLENSKLSYEESLLFLLRLIYPSYYFDLYDKIIQGKEQEKKLNIYINKVDNYEIFIKQVYHIISRYYKLPEIDWIIKT